jgi:hypothetical protein
VTEEIHLNGDLGSSRGRVCVLDSGATGHTTGEFLRDRLSNILDLDVKRRIGLPNGEHIVAAQKGDLAFTVGKDPRDAQRITDVLIVDKVASHTLILVSKLCDAGARVIFTRTEGQVQIRRGKEWRTVIQAKRQGGLYEIPLDAPNVLFYVSENDVNIGGVLQIQNIEENTEIDVDIEIMFVLEPVAPE